MFTPASGLGVALGFAVGLYLHDLAHHWLAMRLGDKTPRLMGRFPPKPSTAADPLGSYVLPAVFVVTATFGHILIPFGWTRTHAFGIRGMRRGKRDIVLVSLIGPAATALLAALGGLAIGVLWPDTGGLLFRAPGAGEMMLRAFVIVNASLTIFELLPLPGRDGARILGQFLSPAAAGKIEELAEYQVLFLLVLFMLLNPVASSMLQVSCSTLAPAACP